MKALAILTAASVLTLAGAAAIAQQAAPAAPPPVTTTAQAQAPAGDDRGQLSRADMAALADARIAAIQAGLKLTPEQQRLWGPVERALRVQMAERVERMEERSERREERAERREERRAGRAVERRTDRMDYMERIEHRSAEAAEEAERMRNLATALKPFWASLDEGQRRLLPRLVREARGDRWHRDGRADRDGRGERQR
jgi:hypothetical protein